MSILSVLFFIPFCRFRGNNRFGGERFPTEEVVIVFFFVLCHINCVEILTTIIYLFHIKTRNFLYKNPRVFYSIFFIATNIANKPLSDSISRPNQLLKEKRNDNNPNNFSSIKLTRKKKNICRTPTIGRQSNLPSNISEFVPWSKLSNLSALH